MDMLCERGTLFYWEGTSDSALYKIKGLTDTPGIIVEGVVRHERDAVSPITTLEGDHLLYVFGEALGDVAITGIILLGAFKGQASGFSTGEKEGSELIEIVTEWFQENRVSVLEKGVDISVAGSGAFECFVTGLTIEKPNPAVQTIAFTFTGIAGTAGGG